MWTNVLISKRASSSHGVPIMKEESFKYKYSCYSVFDDGRGGTRVIITQSMMSVVQMYYVHKACIAAVQVISNRKRDHPLHHGDGDPLHTIKNCGEVGHQMPLTVPNRRWHCQASTNKPHPPSLSCSHHPWFLSESPSVPIFVERLKKSPSFR